MKKSLPLSVESLYQVFSLVMAIIMVHAAYIGVIRPKGQAFLDAQAAMMKADPAHVIPTSVYVVLQDYEQESCFVLLVWAMAIIGFKGVATIRNRALLSSDLIPVAEGMRILPEDAHDLSRQIQALPPGRRESLLPRALLAGLQRFSLTRSIQAVSEATHAYCATEGERLDSELSMIRYIAWAIPSIGFLGTVRGIGEALGHAHKALGGDIFDVIRSLGIAFNSTLVALLISLLLMFLIHQLQLVQERYVLDSEAYCEENLTRHLQVP
jgi:biopolymer transport protein ExbB/TolQ